MSEQNEWYGRQGGAAFPVNTGASQNPGSYSPEIGMSLRDYFAAKAIGSVIENCKGDMRTGGEPLDAYFARISYQIADAMLAAREAKS